MWRQAEPGGSAGLCAAGCVQGPAEVTAGRRRVQKREARVARRPSRMEDAGGEGRCRKPHLSAGPGVGQQRGDREGRRLGRRGRPGLGRRGFGGPSCRGTRRRHVTGGGAFGVAPPCRPLLGLLHNFLARAGRCPTGDSPRLGAVSPAGRPAALIGSARPCSRGGPPKACRPASTPSPRSPAPPAVASCHGCHAPPWLRSRFGRRGHSERADGLLRYLKAALAFLLCELHVLRNAN